jgi:WD40 repeat protein
LAVADPQGPVCVWKLPSGELFRVLGGAAHEVRSLAWSPDSKMLAACADEPTALLWDLASGKGLTAPTLPTFADGIAWSPDGKVLAYACNDRSVQLWEQSSNQMLPPLRDAHNNARSAYEVPEVAWSPDSSKLACGSVGSAKSIWSITPPRQLATLDDTGYGARMVWSPDGKTVAVVAVKEALGKGVRLHSADSGKLLRKFEKAECWARWLDDNRLFTYEAESKTGVVLDAGTGRLLGRTRDGLKVKGSAPGWEVTGFDWGADGRVFLAEDVRYGKVRFYGIDLDKPLIAEKTLFTPEFQRINVTYFAWSPNGETLATGGSLWFGNPTDTDNPVIRLWDMPTGVLRAQDVGMPVGTFRWSPDGKRLGIMPGVSGVPICFWDIGGTGAVMKKQGVYANHSFSPDLALYTNRGEDHVHQLTIREVESGKIRYTWTHPGNGGYGPIFSPDGKRIAQYIPGMNGKERREYLYDLTSGREIESFELRHADRFTWSPDGKYLAGSNPLVGGGWRFLT